MLEYLKKSYLEGVESKTKAKLYFIKKQQLLILAQMGGVFAIFVVCSAFFISVLRKNYKVAFFLSHFSIVIKWLCLLLVFNKVVYVF